MLLPLCTNTNIMDENRIIKYTNIHIKQSHKILDIIKKQISTKVAFIKCLGKQNLPTMSNVHGTGRLGFEGEQTVKTMSFRSTVVKKFILR